MLRKIYRKIFKAIINTIRITILRLVAVIPRGDSESLSVRASELTRVWTAWLSMSMIILKKLIDKSIFLRIFKIKLTNMLDYGRGGAPGYGNDFAAMPKVI